MSTQIAIENGLKLIENCFEKHQVNLDPSSGRSETSTVYRPIDKYMNVLPHLIGSEKWKVKWHVGLLDSDKASHAESEQYAESVDSNPVRSSSLKPDLEASMIPGSSLMASQDLANSISSFDHMVINQSGGLFDDIEHGSLIPPSTSGASASFFQPQPEQRKIVNLFDDEPPSLEPSPVVSRKAENLFVDDDYDSVESPPAPTLENIVKSQPPVDLFNDNEFDDFIRKIEQKPSVIQPSGDNRKSESVTTEVKKAHDMKKITEEMKNVQLKKVQKDVSTNPVSRSLPIKQSSEVKKAEAAPQFKLPEPIIVVKRVEIPPPVQPQPEPAKPRQKKITNLFDDEDEDDYFSQIIKQKAANKTIQPVTPKTVPVKTKPTNLFEDDDDDADSEDLYKHKVEIVEPLAVKKTVSLLFDDDDDPIAQSNPETTKKKTTNLFHDDIGYDPFHIESEQPKIVEKSKVPVATLLDDPLKPEVRPELTGQFLVDSHVQQEKKQVIDDSQVQQVEKQGIEEAAAIENEKETFKNIDASPHENIPDLCEDLPDTSNVQSSIHHSTPSTSFNATLPFLSDEPPDDDSWGTEDHDEEQPDLVFNSKALNYSFPLFDDVPPDDDFMPVSKPSLNKEAEIEKKFHEKIANNISDEDYTKTENQPVTDKYSSPSEINQDSSEEQVLSPPEVELPVSPPEVDLPVPPKPLNNEVDITATSNSIKSKLDKFSRIADETIIFQQSKNPLPGKLNMNLKINVSALMPGARMTTRDTVDRAVDSHQSVNESFSSTSSNTSIVDPNNNNSSLLNNEATKSRPKIQIKRRPSTRRGRQANYQKTLSFYLSDDESEEKPEFSSESFESVGPPSTKNLAASVFDDIDDGEESLNQNHTNPLIFDESPPEPIKTTSKMSVFYDDEDDTRLLVEQQKKKQQTKKEATRQNLSAELFDDLEEDTFANPHIISTSNAVKVDKSKETLTAFYEESGDDLFGGISSSKAETKIVTLTTSMVPVVTKTINTKPKSTAPLFDDNEDDELFGSRNKPTSAAAKKSTKLFGSDDDESETNESISFPKKKPGQPKKKSLFGDDDSDDDLFSSKPKCKLRSSAFGMTINILFQF